MALDAVSRIWSTGLLQPNRLPDSGNGFINPLLKDEPNLKLWLEHPSSNIIHHDRACCETARLWFLSYARSMEIKTGSHCEIKAPTWLSRLFKWGPSEWPISWCQLVREKVVDCGVFAALAREVFHAQGLEVHPAQVLLRYNSLCTGHWQRGWDDGKKDHRKVSDRDFFPWIGNQVVYHEICMLEKHDGKAHFYDSTWGHWYLPEVRAGFNALMAVRSESPRLLHWGDRLVSCGEWIEL